MVSGSFPEGGDMKYELAKELKDTGFPQDWSKAELFFDEKGELYSVGDVDGFTPWKDNPDGSGYHTPSDGGCGCCSGSIGSSVNDFTYCPTLSELIEACPTKECCVFTIEQNTSRKDIVWHAGYMNPDGGYWSGEYEEGKTPLEAVARLWIALQK